MEVVYPTVIVNNRWFKLSLLASSNQTIVSSWKYELRSLLIEVRVKSFQIDFYGIGVQINGSSSISYPKREQQGGDHREDWPTKIIMILHKWQRMLYEMWEMQKKILCENFYCIVFFHVKEFIYCLQYTIDGGMR